MLKTKLWSAMFLIMTLSYTLPCNAQSVPTTLNYQGRLTDNTPQQNPLNGTYMIRFDIFDAATGGTSQWNETDSVTVSSGIFNVLLGASSPFPGTLFSWSSIRYLQITLNPGALQEVLSPRQQFSEVGYANVSFTANTATTANTASSATTATNAAQLGGVASTSWQRSLAPSGCPANQFFNSITQGGSATCATPTASVTPPLSLSGSFSTPIISGSNSGSGQAINGYVNGTGRAATFTINNPASASNTIEGSTDGSGYVIFISNVGTGGGIASRVASSSATAYAVYGYNSSVSGNTVAVYGETASSTGAGIWGRGNNGGVGVYGQSIGTGNAVVGYNNTTGGNGIYGNNGGSNITGYAGYFFGRVAVIGTLSKGGGSFKIDHPLDPENKYLYHSFVESPDMMNIYNGNIVTDGHGEVIVTLPDWFEALNKDFRYQLTVVGEFAQAVVGKKISGNHFVIRTSKPNVEVSWQVTGIRKDPFAEKNRIPVEEEKPANERGLYLYPAAYNQPEEKGIESARHPEMMHQITQDRE